MTTYQQIGANKFDVPAGLPNERPDVVGDLVKFATEVDARFGAGGAEAAANLAAINAIPTSRCYEGKAAYALDTRIRYTYRSGAWQANDSGWTLSTLTVQSGWGSLQDPNGNTSGSLAGGSRLVGQQVELRFRVARTGADLTASSSGNLSPDPTVATLTSPLRPTSVVYGHFFDSGVSSGSARVYPDGTIQITDIYPSDTISNGDIVQIQIAYFLG